MRAGGLVVSWPRILVAAALGVACGGGRAMQPGATTRPAPVDGKVAGVASATTPPTSPAPPVASAPPPPPSPAPLAASATPPPPSPAPLAASATTPPPSPAPPAASEGGDARTAAVLGSNGGADGDETAVLVGGEFIDGATADPDDPRLPPEIAGGSAGCGVRGGRRHRLDHIDVTAAIGAPKVTGGLEPATVRRYIKRNLQKFQYCYERQLQCNGTLAGKVTAKFQIAADGTVSRSSATGVAPEVASCIARQIQKIEFPRPKDGGTVDVTYPFTFGFHSRR